MGELFDNVIKYNDQRHAYIYTRLADNANKTCHTWLFIVVALVKKQYKQE